jgi:RNA polymerase sigma factor (sigma-70 family)
VIALDALKRLILDYKDTNDERMFSEILVHVDKLLLFFIHKLRRDYKYLNSVDTEDLYHTAIIAVHKAIKSYPDYMEPRYIPCRIRAYMISEYDDDFKYVQEEVHMGDMNLDDLNFENRLKTNVINTTVMDYEALLRSLSPDDAFLFENIFVGTKTMKAIGKERGCDFRTIRSRYKRLEAQLAEEATGIRVAVKGSGNDAVQTGIGGELCR